MTHKTLFPRRTCPACGQDYFPGNCAIVSDALPPLKGTILKAATTDLISRAFIPALTGREYTKKRARLQCPNCKKILPRSDTYTIAIVGDVLSGKSHFIASCINQLKQQETWQVLGCVRVSGQDDTDKIYKRDYYDPVYVYREQIKQTRKGLSEILEPLAYEIVFREKSRFSAGKFITLLFYDSSGEDLKNLDRLTTYGHYVLDANAVIFLADPLQMSGIVRELPSSQQPLPPSSGGDSQLPTYDVLNRVIQTLEQNEGINPGQKLETPIAITISKSDLLKYVKPDAFFLRPSAHTNNLDIQEFEKIDGEVRSLIQEFGDKQLLSSSEIFQKKIFLAVSPTGWPADGSGKFPKIESLRCIDPMLWALWQLKLITTI